MSEERKPYVHVVYKMSKCPKCAVRPELEHDGDLTQARHIASRVRCVQCGLRTEWRPTRFQAEIAWEEGVYADSGD